MDDKIHFTDNIKGIGPVDCVFVYSYYNDYLLYLLKHQETNALYLGYWIDIDNEEESEVRWYIPISAEQKSQIDNQTVDLLTLLCANEVLEITASYLDGATLRSRTIMATESGYQLPESGVLLPTTSDMPSFD